MAESIVPEPDIIQPPTITNAQEFSKTTGIPIPKGWRNTFNYRQAKDADASQQLFTGFPIQNWEQRKDLVKSLTTKPDGSQIPLGLDFVRPIFDTITTDTELNDDALNDLIQIAHGFLKILAPKVVVRQQWPAPIEDNPSEARQLAISAMLDFFSTTRHRKYMEEHQMVSADDKLQRRTRVVPTLNLAKQTVRRQPK